MFTSQGKIEDVYTFLKEFIKLLCIDPFLSDDITAEVSPALQGLRRTNIKTTEMKLTDNAERQISYIKNISSDGQRRIIVLHGAASYVNSLLTQVDQFENNKN